MAPDSAVMQSGNAEIESGLYRKLFANVTPQVRESFTAEQRAALAEAARRCNWGSHATDIRFSIPLFSKRYYMVLLAGEERRNPERRKTERARHPVATGGNLLFVGATVTIATLLGSLLWTIGFVWYLSG